MKAQGRPPRSLLGAALMVVAALVAARFAVAAERQPLESVAPPLSVIN
jgi:hypothetical protein